jgi:hypothetical protein
MNSEEIANIFLEGSLEARKRYLSECPDTARKSIAMIAADQDNDIGPVQALHIIADDLVRASKLELGTHMASAAYAVSRALLEKTVSAEEVQLLVSIAGTSALVWADGLLKGSETDEALSVLDDATVWMNRIPSLNQLNRESRESLHLKQLEIFLDEGDIDGAENVLNNRINEGDLSEIQKMNLGAARSRFEKLAREPDDPAVDVSKEEIDTAVASLKQIMALLPQFEMLGFVGPELAYKAQDLIDTLSGEGPYDVAWSAKVTEVLEEVKAAMAKASGR